MILNPFDRTGDQQAQVDEVVDSLRAFVAQSAISPFAQVQALMSAPASEPAPESSPEVDPEVFIDPDCPVCQGVGYTTGGVRCVLCESIQP